MAGNLLIRNLPKKVDEVLQAFKEKHEIKVNTDAACEIIARHSQMIKEIEALKNENRYLVGRINRLEITLKSYLEIKEASEQHFKELIAMAYEE